MRVCAHIDLGVLQDNLAGVRRLAPRSKVLAMIKANAYGHGILECARALDADYYGVATLEEAVSLRDHGFTKRIVLMPGFQTKEELKTVVDLLLDSVVYAEHQLALLEGMDSRPHGNDMRFRENDARLKLWLKIDTGMHRLGCSPEEAPKFLARLEKLKGVYIEAVMTHLACADVPSHPHTLQQIERFKQLTRSWPYPKSVVNSAGITHYPDAHYDIVRPGLMLYDRVMTLESKVAAVTRIEVGEGVGYGQEWTAARPSKIAAVSIGYGDGYPQHPRHAEVEVRGHRAPIVGRVSMDFLSVDVTDIPQVAIGDSILLWGKTLSAHEVAKACSVSTYALLTGVMARVPRNAS